MHHTLNGSAAIAAVATLVVVSPAAAKMCKHSTVYGEAHASYAAAIGVWEAKVSSTFGALWSDYGIAAAKTSASTVLDGKVLNYVVSGIPCLTEPLYRNVPSGNLKPG